MTLTKLTIRLPTHIVQAIDTFIKVGEYGSRTEFIRVAVFRYIKEKTKELSENLSLIEKIQQIENINPLKIRK